MSTEETAVFADGRLAINFLAISAGKLNAKRYNSIDYAIASLERASAYLDDISDFEALTKLSVEELENLNSVVNSIRHGAMNVLAKASASLDAGDPESAAALEKIRMLAIQVIEKSVYANTMISLAIFAKKAGVESELLKRELTPFDPRPTVYEDLASAALQAYEKGEYQKP